MDTLFAILKVLGSLGIFIYGMKVMSDGIQKVAGGKLRKILAGMTSSRLTGIFTGFTTTALVQSSSATTVMVVSFVNAGLLTLVQATGVIMGANIGTTVSAWLISLLGFGKVDITAIAVGIIGLTFPFLFSGKDSLKNLAEFVIGFGILFIGLEFLKGAVPNFQDNPQALDFLNRFTDLGFLSTVIFVIVGTLLTIIVQSSSATMAITLVMVANGWIGFDTAAAVVLGENLGTTITANIAALVGNIHAKRAARFHSLFNIIGIIWIMALLPYFTDLVDILNESILHSGTSVYTDDVEKDVLTDGLAMFHTCFNILNTILLFGFAPYLVKWVVRLSPSRSKMDEEFSLKYISSGLMATPEMSLEEAHKEIQLFGKMVEKMCANFMMALFKDPRNLDKLLNKIRKREEMTDDLQLQIATYLSQVGQYKLSQQSAVKSRSMIRMITDLERMGDIFYKLSLNKKRMTEQKMKFPESVKKELEEYFDLIYRALKEMNYNLSQGDNVQVNMSKVFETEDEINKIRDHLKKLHYDRIEKASYPIQDGIIFLDYVNSAEKLGDHIVNVNQAIAGIK